MIKVADQAQADEHSIVVDKILTLVASEVKTLKKIPSHPMQGAGLLVAALAKESISAVIKSGLPVDKTLDTLVRTLIQGMNIHLKTKLLLAERFKVPNIDITMN